MKFKFYHDYLNAFKNPLQKALNAELLVMVPNDPFMINRYQSSNPSPFMILMDKGFKVTGQYFQVNQFFSIGTPTMFVVDQKGKISYSYYTKLTLKKTSNKEPPAVLTELNT